MEPVWWRTGHLLVPGSPAQVSHFEDVDGPGVVQMESSNRRPGWAGGAMVQACSPAVI